MLACCCIISVSIQTLGCNISIPAETESPLHTNTMAIHLLLSCGIFKVGTHRPESDVDSEQFISHSHQSLQTSKKKLCRCMGGHLRLVHTVHFFVCDCDLFRCDFMKWNGLYVGLGKCSHGTICSACDAFLCVMLHMNGFHTHSVQLQCAIAIYIHSKSHPHPSYHVNNFIKSHVNKSQSQTKKPYHMNETLRSVHTKRLRH